jgi:hypothetical protein
MWWDLIHIDVRASLFFAPCSELHARPWLVHLLIHASAWATTGACPRLGPHLMCQHLAELFLYRSIVIHFFSISLFPSVLHHTMWCILMWWNLVIKALCPVPLLAFTLTLSFAFGSCMDVQGCMFSWCMCVPIYSLLGHLSSPSSAIAHTPALGYSLRTERLQLYGCEGPCCLAFSHWRIMVRNWLFACANDISLDDWNFIRTYKLIFLSSIFLNHFLTFTCAIQSKREEKYFFFKDSLSERGHEIMLKFIFLYTCCGLMYRYRHGLWKVRLLLAGLERGGVARERLQHQVPLPNLAFLFGLSTFMWFYIIDGNNFLP